MSVKNDANGGEQISIRTGGENKPSSLVVSLDKALNGMPVSLSG